MVGADGTMEVGGHNTFYLKDNEFSLPNLVAVRLVHTSCQMLQLLQWTAMCKDRKFSISVQKYNCLLQVMADSQCSVNQP